MLFYIILCNLLKALVFCNCKLERNGNSPSPQNNLNNGLLDDLMHFFHHSDFDANNVQGNPVFSIIFFSKELQLNLEL